MDKARSEKMEKAIDSIMNSLGPELTNTHLEVAYLIGYKHALTHKAETDG